MAYIRLQRVKSLRRQTPHQAIHLCHYTISLFLQKRTEESPFNRSNHLVTISSLRLACHFPSLCPGQNSKQSLWFANGILLSSYEVFHVFLIQQRIDVVFRHTCKWPLPNQAVLLLYPMDWFCLLTRSTRFRIPTRMRCPQVTMHCVCIHVCMHARAQKHPCWYVCAYAPMYESTYKYVCVCVNVRMHLHMLGRI